MRLEEKFRRAGRDGIQYRGAPFWSWNDDLQPEELRRQIREMKEAGLGGYFMHARVGLITPYLSERWMECIDAAVDEGRKIGIAPWLYDENSWPSGSAGGLVPGLGPQYQQKTVELAEVYADEYEPQHNALATFVGSRQGKAISDLVFLPDHRLPADVGSRNVFHFYYTARGYADVLKPEAIARFIEFTHEAYKRRVGSEFAKAIPGIFTDEPQYRAVPWTEDLPRIFSERHGYDLLENMISLFYEVGDFQRVRYDFWSLVTDLYVAAFSKQVFDWCERHDLVFTGHQEMEDTLLGQVRRNGCAMQHYEYMQMPGMDHLGNHLREPLACKQVSSVAHQFGGRRSLCETYGTAGWNLSFEDQKWIGDWMYAEGIDFMCQHLQLYSLKGVRKRDHPPSYSQQPWWPHYRVLMDYYARLGAALTSGRHKCDLLLLHPMGTVWSVYDPNDDRPVQEVSEQFLALSNSLLQIHRDYDYGEEKILERHGAVEGSNLRVGAARYKIVIVPPCLTMRTKVLDLLLRFAAAGGRIIAVEPLPAREQGVESQRPAEELRRVATIIANDRDELRLVLDDMVEPEIVIFEHDSTFERVWHALGRHEEDAHSIIYQQRDAGDRQLFFLANTDKREVHAEVRLRGRGLLEQWDLTTGKVTPAPSQYAAGYTTARFTFAPAGSLLIALNRGQEPLEETPPALQVVRRVPFEDRWQVEPQEHNALTLDYCAFRMGEGEWHDEVPTIWLNQSLRGMTDPTPLVMRFSFPVEFDPSRARDLFLIIETPERYVITVNGKTPPPAHGWWADPAFQKIDISGLLRDGINVVELAATAGAGLEVESIYVIGDFGVARSGSRWEGGPPLFALTEASSQARTGDLGPQGYRFFRGAVVYRQELRVPLQEGERAFLRLEGMAAALARVVVNGKPAGFIGWRPHEVEVTELLNRRRTNVFEIELIGSCRNLLGPHHNVRAEPIGIGPRNFAGGPDWVTDPRSSDSIWRDRYAFVPFGITKGAHVAVMEEVEG